MDSEQYATIYAALLVHPHDAWRAEHQWLYALLRDAIAAKEGLEPEVVQIAFEAIARARMI